ncbi:MAG: O-antigen ligase family protein [Deltaproteobacteria bacterium]|nr:O-antigen ligase family protein [Deltaproteobacteria bacterium]MCL5878242.1 O-antigen ligase family protein [Deltaproteobacteria bacterium]
MKKPEIKYLFLAFIGTIYLSISLYEAVLVFILFIFILRLRLIRIYQLKGFLTIPVLLFFVGMLVPTMLFEIHSQYATQAVLRAFFAIIYFPALLYTTTEDNLLKKYAYIIVIGGILFSAVAYIKYFLLRPEHASGLWGSGFELGNIVSLSICVSIALLLSTKDSTKKILFIAAFFFMFGATVLTFERTAWLDVFWGIVFLFVALHHKIKIKPIVFIASGIIILVLFSILLSVFAKHDPRFIILKNVLTNHTISLQEINTLSSDRIYKLKASFAIIKHDIETKHYTPLIIGHGFRAGSTLAQYYGNQPVKTSFESISFLGEYIDTGIIGILYMLLIYGAFIKLLLRVRKLIQQKQEATFLLAGLTAGIGAYFFGSLFNMFATSTFFYYLFLFGIVERYVKFYS